MPSTDAEHAAVLRHFWYSTTSDRETVAAAIERAIELLEREERRARDQYISDLYQ